MVSTRSSARRSAGPAAGDAEVVTLEPVAVATITAAQGTKTSTRAIKRTGSSADAGQPEVSSPTKQAQPLPPVPQSPPGSPLTEKLVKSVGGGPRTAARTATAPPTPGAQAVQFTSQMPLPKDSVEEPGPPYETESDDDPPATTACHGSSSAAGAIFFNGLFLVVTMAVLTTVLACYNGDFMHLLPAAVRGGVAPVCARLPPAHCFAKTPGAIMAALQDLQHTGMGYVANAGHHASATWAKADSFTRQQLARCRSHAELYVAHAAVWSREAVARIKSLVPVSAPPALTFNPALQLHALQSLLCDCPQHQQYAAELWDAFPKQLAEKQKAAAVVLACNHGAECAVAALGAAAAAEPSVLRLEGSTFGSEDSAGALQVALAAFLRESPRGVVLATDPELFSMASLSVLNAAMSESGHIQMNGKPVSTSEALYVFVYNAGAALPHDGYEALVAEQLSSALLARGGGDERAAAVVLSFRRRLDAVLLAKELPAPAPPAGSTAPDAEIPAQISEEIPEEVVEEIPEDAAVMDEGVEEADAEAQQVPDVEVEAEAPP